MGPIWKEAGIFNKYAYDVILDNPTRRFALNFICRAFIYELHKDTKHRSKRVMASFDRRGTTFIDWPRQSPDMNMIEPLWEEFSHRLFCANAYNATERFVQKKRE